jgi:hypothetical protein
MIEDKVKNRLAFLAKQFNVFDSDLDSFSNELSGYDVYDISKGTYIIKGVYSISVEDSTWDRVLLIKVDNNNLSVTRENVVAIIGDRLEINNQHTTKISLSSKVFMDLVSADPTDNNMYVQWLLNVTIGMFKKVVENNSTSEFEKKLEVVERLLVEDIPLIFEHLKLFDGNKRKRLFSEMAKANSDICHIKDPTNINQYKTVSELFDAIDPFIVKNSSEVERTLETYIKAGKAEIGLKNRHFTVFIPKTKEASAVFQKFASWCTAVYTNSNFVSYTSRKKPNGKDSDLYIVIPNNFFSGKSDDLIQVHFESQQIHDRRNASSEEKLKSWFNDSAGLRMYFYNELLPMAKDYSGDSAQNKYLTYLLKFGFSDALFEILDERTSAIKYLNSDIKNLPDLSKFDNVSHFIICESGLLELHPSINKLTKLEILSLSGNKLTTLPKEVGDLKNLALFNIIGNKITSIPDEIKYLDITNGGSLLKMQVLEKDVGKENFKKLKELLPSADWE